VNRQNHLEIGGCDLVALAREYGTPLYLFDDAHLRSRAREVREAFQSRWNHALPLYATKAYFSPYLARIFKDAGLGIDVTSEGELEIARRVDYPRDRIYLHGNNKTAAEIRAALALGVEHIIVDNLDEIDLLAGIASELNASRHDCNWWACMSILARRFSNGSHTVTRSAPSSHLGATYMTYLVLNCRSLISAAGGA
jgi:diaminopimelate decarboxylase